jgi:rRNA small subunit pseudouridine methyltransferase Nep1
VCVFEFVKTEKIIMSSTRRGKRGNRRRKSKSTAAAAAAAAAAADDAKSAADDTQTQTQTQTQTDTQTDGKSESIVQLPSTDGYVPVNELQMNAETNARESKRRIIVVLEKAALETVKTKRGYELLNADMHKGILKKHNKDPSDYRPDILHQCLLTLLDSPLSKAGLLQVFIHTNTNVAIQVNPRIRIPRTFKRFCGLMVQLLHKMKIRASNSAEVLLKVVKNPITQHLPVGAVRIGTSVNAPLVDMREFAPSLPQNQPIVFVVGSQAHGDALVDWADKNIGVSRYPLSASNAIARILTSFEFTWDIL